MSGVELRITNTVWSDDRTTISFSYALVTDEKTFELKETLKFPAPIPRSYETDQLIRALHIALSISYYKSFVPPVIQHPYAMTETEASFWNNVFEHGLSEFLFMNQLPYDVLATFTAQDGNTSSASTRTDWKHEAMLGIGGGKDSIVGGELLRKVGLPFGGVALATGQNVGQTSAVAEKMGVGLQVVERTIDPQIIEINKLPGAYNGHIPISLIYGLVGAVLAAAHGMSFVMVGNESSASIPRTTWQNHPVNHQWSKSLEFEQLFQDYLHTNASKELHYTSVIRPLSSVAVAKLFAQFPQYFDVFTSDNSVLKLSHDTDSNVRWSKVSTKSLSSFILLAPWIDKTTLIAAFGHNFLDDAALEDTFRKLLGGAEEVVLDCVGTPEELCSCIKQLEQSDFSGDHLVELAKAEALCDRAKPLSAFYQLDRDALPEPIKDVLRTTMKELLDV